MAPAAPGLTPSPSDLGRADEVRVFNGSTTFDEGNSAGDTKTASASMDIDDAVELLAVRSEIWAIAEEADQGVAAVDPSGISVEAAAGVVQISTRDSFADTGGDNDIPSGVYVHDHWQAQSFPTFEDETNQSGGVGGGNAQQAGETLWLPQSAFPEVVEARLQGVTFSAHYKVTSIPDGIVQLRAPTWLYVRLV